MDPILMSIYEFLLYVELVLATVAGALYISAARLAPPPYRFLKIMLGADLIFAAIVILQLFDGTSALDALQVRIGYTVLLMLLIVNAIVGRRRYDI